MSEEFDKQAAARAESAQLNRDLLDAIQHAENGELTKQGKAATNVVRVRIREESFKRKILPYVDISDSDLDYMGNSELPAVWGELEPDSPAAKTIAYNDSPDTAFFRAEKFVTLMSVITTEEMTKNVNELRTYKADIRKIVLDNLLRDIHTHEDARWMTSTNRVVGVQVDLSAATVDSQNVQLPGTSISREAYKKVLNFLPDRDIENGAWLMNRRTINEFIAFDRAEMGGDKAQALFLEGAAALKKFVIGGVPHIGTIKRALVANGEVFQFAEPDFLGRAYRLEDIKVTMQKEFDIIKFRASEQVGDTIANTAAVQRVYFPNER